MTACRSISGTDQQPGSNLSLRVLVVDDDVDTTLSTALLLRIRGHETRTALDGKGALVELSAFAPDVVLLDIGLPDMTGFEVARRMLDHPLGQDVSLVAVTGWSRTSDRECARAAGFEYHFVKPLDPEALVALLARIRCRRRERDP